MIILIWFLMSSWLSDGQFCRVVEDSQNFVECACTHLSVYTAYAETTSLASFNEAFYAAGFICISGNSLPSTWLWGYKSHQAIMHCSCICLSPAGFALAVLTHVLCSRFLMFAAKLLTHMMVACLGTQVRSNLTSNVVSQLNFEGKQHAYSNKSASPTLNLHVNSCWFKMVWSFTGTPIVPVMYK